MWAAKLPGEGALLFDACKAMCELMKELGVAIDGGKDSLSMAARVGTETVKAPGNNMHFLLNSIIISSLVPPSLAVKKFPCISNCRLLSIFMYHI